LVIVPSVAVVYSLASGRRTVGRSTVGHWPLYRWSLHGRVVVGRCTVGRCGPRRWSLYRWSLYRCFAVGRCTVGRCGNYFTYVMTNVNTCHKSSHANRPILIQSSLWSLCLCKWHKSMIAINTHAASYVIMLRANGCADYLFSESLTVHCALALDH
jgi:hypothetical protein